MQCLWTVLLTLSGQYSDLLDYVVFAVLLFYILTIAGLFRLRRTRPDMERPYKAVGYPVLPALYIAMAGLIEALLLLNDATRTYAERGLILVLLGLPIYRLWRQPAPRTTLEHAETGALAAGSLAIFLSVVGGGTGFGLLIWALYGALAGALLGALTKGFRAA
jgi:APA family basic amino acid/polyamine antiporter